MEEIISLLVIFLLLPLLQRVFGRREPRQLPPETTTGDDYEPVEHPSGAAEVEGAELEKDLETLILEELGLKPRRPHESQKPVESQPAPGWQRDTEVEPSVPVDRGRRVVFPTPREVEVEPAPRVPVDTRRLELERRREERSQTRRRRAELTEKPAALEAVKVEVAATPARRKRRGARLPDSGSWSQIKRAIVWSEILGPPKGLSE